MSNYDLHLSACPVFAIILNDNEVKHNSSLLAPTFDSPQRAAATSAQLSRCSSQARPSPAPGCPASAPGMRGQLGALSSTPRSGKRANRPTHDCGRPRLSNLYRVRRVRRARAARAAGGGEAATLPGRAGPGYPGAPTSEHPQGLNQGLCRAPYPLKGSIPNVREAQAQVMKSTAN